MHTLHVFLKDIPSTGLDIWTDLKARSERSKVEGQLHLKLSIATREERDLPEDERQFETKQHCDLITIFIDHELRKSKVSLSIFLIALILLHSTFYVFLFIYARLLFSAHRSINLNVSDSFV